MCNNHFFHLVSFSPWPLVLAMNIFNVGFSLMVYLTNMASGLLYGSFFLLILVLFQWWRDVVREGLYEGCHTLTTMKGMDLGFVGFIVSELFFFFSFFWMYFYSSLSPDFSVGMSWPPAGFVSVSFTDIPLLNTFILVCSGFFITWSHFSLFFNFNFNFYLSYLFCLLLGFYFLLIQLYEYFNLSFDFTDGIFGCSFFILTGFHGFHVILGVIFLLVGFFRFLFGHFSFLFMKGCEYSIWYWHFVDVVWLFLYLFIYWWGM